MSEPAALTAVALVMCAILVAAGISRRGGFVAHARGAAIWAAIIIGLAIVLTWLGWR